MFMPLSTLQYFYGLDIAKWFSRILFFVFISQHSFPDISIFLPNPNLRLSSEPKDLRS